MKMIKLLSYFKRITIYDVPYISIKSTINGYKVYIGFEQFEPDMVFNHINEVIMHVYLVYDIDIKNGRYRYVLERL